ncbi:MAG: PASTA domain-containing protein [Sphingobacteriaceae bacterium]|nr:MAG: PASTA domain-containing protein [Sphingobacteriaceae bacterium]
MSSFFAYLKSKSFLTNVILAAVTVLVVVLITVFSLNYYTRHGSGIPVPKLIGMQISRASALLDDQGFEYKIDSVYLPDREPGTVVQQDPDPATNVKENRTIYLTVITRLAPDIGLPDLENITFREATATISNAGLKLGDTTYRSDIALNHVLEVRFAGEKIRPGAKLPKGSRIDLVLGDGKGASEVDIPDLTDQELDAAKFAISGAGLTVGTVTYEGSITDSTKVVVKSQSPMRTDSTTKTSIGTRINLTVSQGN